MGNCIAILPDDTEDADEPDDTAHDSFLKPRRQFSYCHTYIEQSVGGNRFSFENQHSLETRCSAEYSLGERAFDKYHNKSLVIDNLNDSRLVIDGR